MHHLPIPKISLIVFSYTTDEFQRKGYDNYYRIDYPKKRFDTVICNYVLNVLEPEEQVDVLMSVSELLKPTGTAYFAIRRDLKNEHLYRH
jgi:2-polyprenyl-3-methyl-5-hydroxy-6-metoxy-1,4-benzoquinol methylase